MKIFNTSGDTECYQPLRLDNPKEGSIFTFHKRGEPFGASWTPLPVTLTKIDNRKTRFKVKSKLIGDFPELGIHACFTRHAIDSLSESYLRQFGELLPFQSRDGVEYFWFNCTTVVDAFDRANSTYEKYPDGYLGHITKYAFFGEKTNGHDMFVDEQTKMSLVTDRFKARVEAAGLTGMLFKELWSDESKEPVKIRAEVG